MTSGLHLKRHRNPNAARSLFMRPKANGIKICEKVFALNKMLSGKTKAEDFAPLNYCGHRNN